MLSSCWCCYLFCDRFVIVIAVVVVVIDEAVVVGIAVLVAIAVVRRLPWRFGVFVHLFEHKSQKGRRRAKDML